MLSLQFIPLRSSVVVGGDVLSRSPNRDRHVLTAFIEHIDTVSVPLSGAWHRVFAGHREHSPVEWATRPDCHDRPLLLT